MKRESLGTFGKSLCFSILHGVSSGVQYVWITFDDVKHRGEKVVTVNTLINVIQLYHCLEESILAPFITSWRPRAVTFRR